jgi:hypothetical protein
VLEVATCVAPRFLSIQILPVVVLVTNGIIGRLAGLPTTFVQFIPLYTCNSPLESQLLQYTINPIAGVVMLLRSSSDILGGKKPFVVLSNSKIADGSGVVVPMPTWAYVLLAPNKASAKKLKIIFFITVIYLLFNLNINTEFCLLMPFCATKPNSQTSRLPQKIIHSTRDFQVSNE